mmetsp:Transcript_30646/g.67879  ORF Transcript_30646/g.67879 Transcript_30646/m.67879 type:complete len:206 (-) Transcript_30646:1022-1639(-)
MLSAVVSVSWRSILRMGTFSPECHLRHRGTATLLPRLSACMEGVLRPAAEGSSPSVMKYADESVTTLSCTAAGRGSGLATASISFSCLRVASSSPMYASSFSAAFCTRDCVLVPPSLMPCLPMAPKEGRGVMPPILLSSWLCCPSRSLILLFAFSSCWWVSASCCCRPSTALRGSRCSTSACACCSANCASASPSVRARTWALRL